jgi:hypothetical protein
VDHSTRPLQASGLSRIVVGQRAHYAVVESSCLEIGFKLRINRLRIVLVKPFEELFHLLWFERRDCSFDFVNRLQIRPSSVSILDN